MINKFILKVKRRETPFYSFLYNIGKRVNSLSFPSIKFLHLPLYHFDFFVKNLFKRLLHFFWSIPLFKARCSIVGRNLKLPNGIPLVIGGHLKLILGNNVTIGRTTIGASKIFDDPVLKIGDNSTIGYGTVISVSKEVVICNNCMIGPNCIIMDSDDHPINPIKRLEKLPVEPANVKSVKIGNNVWIGSHCAILKGVTIGDNSIIATHTVISKDVMPNCIYAGYPARPTLRDIHLMDES